MAVELRPWEVAAIRRVDMAVMKLVADGAVKMGGASADDKFDRMFADAPTI